MSESLVRKNGMLRVWWIPQVPMKSFNIEVFSLEEAKLLLDTLAEYDRFQFENNIKPDYSNAGGLMIWSEEMKEIDLENEPDNKDPGWTDWYDEKSGDEFEHYVEAHPELFPKRDWDQNKTVKKNLRK